MKDKIRSYFKEFNKEITDSTVEIVSDMVRQKTVNVIPEKMSEHPYLEVRGEEWRVADIIEKWFREWGIGFERFEREKGRTNIIGKLGRGDEGYRKLFMAAHLDVVPAGDGWSTDPFEPTIKDGNIIGRGVLDNKGPMVSAMMAAKALIDLGIAGELPGELMVAGLADEEAAGEFDCGIEYLLEEKLINPTDAIIPDIGENMKSIDVAEKGRIVVQATSKGKQAHGSTPELGVNAIFPMARFLTLAEKLDLEYVEHPYLGGWTMNLGEIRGGAAANIVPAECVVFFDFRLVPGQTTDQVLDKLKEFAAEAGGEFEFTIQGGTEPHEIDPDNDLVKAIKANSIDVLGFEPEPYGLGGGTFAKTLNLHGITAVGFGPGDDTAFHVADEFVEIGQLVQFAELISLVAVDLLT